MSGANVEKLIAALRAGNRQQSLVLLGQVGAEALEPLITLLNDPDPALCSAAACLLGDLADARAVPSLIKTLEHAADPEVRLWAADSLRLLRDARSIEPLITMLRSGEADVREVIVRALGETAEAIDSPRAVAALTGALTDADWGTRQSAAEMLIRLKADPDGAAEKLLLTDLQDADAEIRLGAAYSLVELGDPRAFDPLVSLLDHPDPRISGSAVWGLGELGDQRAVAPLTALLNHADESVRQSAESALRRLNETDS